VTQGNQHLEVTLFDDECQQSLGRMSLLAAQNLAKTRERILVLYDESHDPPDVRLMTGKRLAYVRDETRTAKKREQSANEKIVDFVVRIRAHIDDNDLQTKMTQAKAAYVKGSTIRFVLEFGHNIDEKEIEKLVSQTARLFASCVYASVLFSSRLFVRNNRKLFSNV
jgi:translation initiation factor IF-3